MAGADQGPPAAAGQPGAAAPGDEGWRDWAGLPEHLLMKVAGKLIVQTEAGWAAYLKLEGCMVETIQRNLAQRKRKGNCLFVFAMVCKNWRKAQLKVGGPLCSRVASDVTLPGSVALAKWALAEGCPRENEDGFTMAHAAALHGHMVLVRWLIKEQGFAVTRSVIEDAAFSGNMELVQWLRGEGCDWNARTCRLAAAAGRLAVLQWLRANGCPWDAETCKRAALGGHLETLRWARKNGCDWDAEACAWAAMGGHLDVLQWLRAEGCPWDAEACSQAALNGHLETLRWARENGCDWSTQTCLNAAAGGHLGILQWLRAEGCPWDDGTCELAVEEGHEEVLRWARENGCPWCVEDRDRAAAELGYTDDLGNLVDMDGNLTL